MLYNVTYFSRTGNGGYLTRHYIYVFGTTWIFLFYYISLSLFFLFFFFFSCREIILVDGHCEWLYNDETNRDVSTYRAHTGGISAKELKGKIFLWNKQYSWVQYPIGISTLIVPESGALELQRQWYSRRYCWHACLFSHEHINIDSRTNAVVSLQYSRATSV